MVFIGTVLVSHLVQAEGRNRHLKMWAAVAVVALTFTWLECSLSLDYLPTIDWRIHSTLVSTCVIAAFTVIFVFASWFLLQFLGYRPVRLTKDANNKID
jgi:protein-S-isoprenylcysteine O-methyltransferase Ste14